MHRPGRFVYLWPSTPFPIPFPDGDSGRASEFRALFCKRLTAWLPPLTILWTLSPHEVVALTPKIVKDGTPDRRGFPPDDPTAFVNSRSLRERERVFKTEY